jgi:RHS repeat-associated protein
LHRIAVSAAPLALSFLLLFGLSDPLWSSSFTRDGSDRIDSASFSSGAALSFSYDASHGQITDISDAGASGFSLELVSDAMLHLPVSQAVRDEASGDTLLSAAITYDAGGHRASRTVSAGSEWEGSATTSYWYGDSLHPLVVTRDGVNYRLIGKEVVEEVGGGPPTRSYLQADRLGSVRVVTDDEGAVMQSLSYDGDYGLTRIAGENSAVADDSMASFYRFQGQEQEVFPLAKLGIEDDALAQWLDQIQLYHFPWRDYAAGLAAFTQSDPVPTEDSLYAALGANPVNYTDETGGMIGDQDTSNDGRIADLLDQLLHNRELQFPPEDRDLLRQRLHIIATGVQNLIDRSEGLTDRIVEIGRQLRQAEQALQRTREQEARLQAIRLVSEHQSGLLRMHSARRQQHIAILLRTADELSHRRTSAAERLLADRYFQLQQREDALQGELQTANAERQDLENWLDIYQVPILQMWDPDESPSEAEDEEDEESFPLPIGSPVSFGSESESDDNADDVVAPRHGESDSDRPRDGSPRDRANDRGQDDQS